ncbi:PepSY-associated TM helix domain-containing protein [Novipirellula rosea]|uniref:PepSY-associated TM helix domain-containing protein n=2 Tax=Novipirellula rosea TaxID=1031540 RepID=A0ABP8MS96_9BACT
MSSAISLVGMILFAITGITLNHASQIETTPTTRTWSEVLPPRLQASIALSIDEDSAELPEAVSEWIGNQLAISIPNHQADWSEDEVYLSMPGPGSDAWLAIDRSSGAVEFESTHRGWISFFNDLHKGRHTGVAWSWFLDVFAVATLVFCITGLLLLYERATHRRWTWPLVALGLIAPWILIILFIH